MFLIPCALLTALIAIFVIWASWGNGGNCQCVGCYRHRKQLGGYQPCSLPLEKGGRNPPPPANFQKPVPTQPPPKKP